MKKKTIENIKVIIFSIWIFASFFATVFMFSIEPWYGAMIFGQIFLVLSIFLLINKNINGIFIMFGGLAFILIPYFELNPGIIGYTNKGEITFLTLLFSTLVLSAPFLILVPIIGNKRLEKMCGAEVLATIVDHHVTFKRDELGEEKIYFPVYEFYFEGNKYSVTNSIYSDTSPKEVGTKVKLRINPNNPEEFMKKPKLKLSFIITGIIFLIAAIPLLVMLMQSLGGK